MNNNQRLALLFLGIGTILFALGPAVLKLLTNMGGSFGLQNPGAISFCNVLFVGNFCAGIVTLIAFGTGPLFSELKRLPSKTKIALLLGAIVSTIYPALMFTALERTSVISIVLLSRFNGIVFVTLAYFFYRATVRKSEVIGYAVIALGVTVLVIVKNQGLRISTGELLILIATPFFALTEFISKRVLQDCSIQAYVFFRNLVSSIIFFALAVYFFGFHHFEEAFSGELWILMIIYAGFAVVIAQLSWLKATRVLPISVVANSQLLNPGISIAFAYLLLMEVPRPLEWVVMVIILIGMLIPKLSQWGRSQIGTKQVALSMGMVRTH